uniref:Uncharacterized protein n=1 Tax=Ursus maritimus TaxID=29073 RepID=A0A452TDW1_URSMA
SSSPTPRALKGLIGPARGSRCFLPRSSQAAMGTAQDHGYHHWTHLLLCFLLPWGWVLPHLESYRKQE